MSMDDGNFAIAIRNTIAEPAVRMVNFRANGLTIGTMHFLTISGAITTGSIHCKVDASKITSGAVAVYNADQKTIYGSRAEGFYADEKSTFIHECTHAIIHLTGFSGPVTVKVVKNESAAYLAAAIYVVASGQLINTSKPNSPFATAYRLVKAKGVGAASATATNAATPIDFSDGELAPLAAAIKSDPLYKTSWNTDEKYRW